MMIHAGHHPAFAQDYPARPIRLLIGYAAGGTADLSWRIIGPLLGERLGQPVVIENRPGAGGLVASQAALSAPADGYTFVLAATGNFGISPVLMRSMPFDAVKDFEPVAQVASFGYVFATSSSSRLRNIRDVIEFGKTNPGKLSIGTIQVGSAQFFAAEYFKSVAGISAVTVPFRTSGDVVSAARSGEVQLIVDTIAPVLPHVRSGALRALGVTEDAPFPGLPDALPISSNGLPGYVISSWNGLMAKKGTPAAVIQRVTRALVEVVETDEVKRRFIDLGVVATYGDPRVLRELQTADLRRWGEVMVSSRIEKQ